MKMHVPSSPSPSAYGHKSSKKRKKHRIIIGNLGVAASSERLGAFGAVKTVGTVAPGPSDHGGPTRAALAPRPEEGRGGGATSNY